MRFTMGIEIFMQWKKQTKPELKKQSQDESRNRIGGAPFLFTANHMKRETHLLQTIFSEYWNGGTTKPYDFVRGKQQILTLAVPYFVSFMPINQLLCTKKQTIELGHEFIKKSHENSFENDSMSKASRKSALELLELGIAWFDSLIEFVNFGIEKQQAGLQPYPAISR